MYCKSCGNKLDEGVNFCFSCGTKVGEGHTYCGNCGTAISGDNTCSNCGEVVTVYEEIKSEQQSSSYNTSNDYNTNSYSQNYSEPVYNTTQQYGKKPKSKIAAGVLGILVGGLGIHRFYLGYTAIGVTQILVTILTCGWGSLWGFIEGILILCGSAITTDADGVPLSD